MHCDLVRAGSIQPCPAETTVGYDCSGLTRWAYFKAFGSDVNDGATGTQVRIFLIFLPLSVCFLLTVSPAHVRASLWGLRLPDSLSGQVDAAHAEQRCLVVRCSSFLACSQEGNLSAKKTTNPVPGDLIFWDGASSCLHYRGVLSHSFLSEMRSPPARITLPRCTMVMLLYTCDSCGIRRLVKFMQCSRRSDVDRQFNHESYIHHRRCRSHRDLLRTEHDDRGKADR